MSARPGFRAAVTAAVLVAACAVEHGSSGAASVAAQPTQTPCSYTYSDWRPAFCPARGVRSRTVIPQGPPGCAGTPALEQTCVAPSTLTWFTPLDPLSRQRIYGGTAPYMELFSEDAEWADAAARTSVFKIYPQWIVSASDAELRAMFADLRRRAVALALEYGVLNETDACGRGIEGYGGGSLLWAARRIRSNGGELRAVAFDEPIFYGTIYTGTGACRWTVAQMAADAAVNIRALKAEFPEVALGDIEPLPTDWSPDWLRRYADGLDAFRAALGYPLAFFHADVDWRHPSWGTAVDAMRSVARERGMPFGVIYNGDNADATDRDWLQKARARMEEYELASDAPEHAVFQSWHAKPEALLPESDPGAFTNLINLYGRERLSLKATRTADGVAGALQRFSGVPIPDARITVTGTPQTGSGVVATYEATGRVPYGTVAIVMGVRLNTECAGCNGQTDALLNSFTFDTASLHIVRNFSAGLAGWTVSNLQAVRLEGSALRIVNDTTRSFKLNSIPWPVRSGEDYRFSVSARVAPASLGSGSFTLIFYDRSEIDRAWIPLAPAKVPLATATTGRLGTWQAAIPSTGLDGYLIRAEYAGDAAWWPARSVVISPDGAR